MIPATSSGERATTVGGWSLALAAASDVGRVRRENQDAWALDVHRDSSALLVVADGLGGEEGGAQAAAAAATAAVEAMAATADPHRAHAPAVAAADAAVAAALRDGGFGLGGTTLVTASVGAGLAVVGWVGDSRAHLVRGRVVTALTRDHSWVEDELRAGRLSPEAAAHHPRRNLLSRAVMGEGVSGEQVETGLVAGDVLLLSSDGFWGALDDAAIAELVAGAGDLDAVVARCVEAALDAGSSDNVTVAACRVEAVAPRG